MNAEVCLRILNIRKRQEREWTELQKDAESIEEPRTNLSLTTRISGGRNLDQKNKE